MNRSLSAAIGVAVVVLGCVGLLALTAVYGGIASGQSLAAASPVSGAAASQRFPAAPQVSDSGRSRAAVTPAPMRALVGNTAEHHRLKIRRFIGVVPGPPLMRSVASFAKITGVHPALVEIYTGFNTPFPRGAASQVVAYGSVPFVQWNPRRAPLRTIDKGKFNTYIRQFAAEVKAFKHHIILSFGHEMNGSWSRWSRPFATPAQFIAAWRLIHKIFTNNHVRNVTWSWDPSHGGSSARQWWPGSAYVDRIGIDGYFRHGQTFREIFRKQLKIIRRITKKPVFIAETSVARSRGQARQVRGLFHGLRRYHLAGFVWFDINRLEIWRLEGRRWAIKAFRKCTTKSVKCR